MIMQTVFKKEKQFFVVVKHVKMAPNASFVTMSAPDATKKILVEYKGFEGRPGPGHLSRCRHLSAHSYQCKVFVVNDRDRHGPLNTPPPLTTPCSAKLWRSGFTIDSSNVQPKLCH